MQPGESLLERLCLSACVCGISMVVVSIESDGGVGVSKSLMTFKSHRHSMTEKLPRLVRGCVWMWRPPLEVMRHPVS